MKVHAILTCLTWTVLVLSAGAVSLPVTSGSLSDDQKAALNQNQYDSIDKTGDGEFTLADIASFAGKINVNGGTVVANDNGLGTTDCEITVVNGATLKLNMKPYSRKITIAGTGVDSIGALYLDGNKSCELNNLHLSAAAKIGTTLTRQSGGMVIGGTFTMNGYELTVQNGTMLYFKPTVVNDPADIWIVGEDFLCPETSMPPSQGHKFIFNQVDPGQGGRKGVTLWKWTEGCDSDWGLDFRDSWSSAMTAGPSNSVLKWSGDITIPVNGTKKFQTVGSSVFEFHGNISGGTFYKENTGCEFRFYGDNRSLGKISGSLGAFCFMNKNSLPESFASNGGWEPAQACVVVLQSASDDNVGGWTESEIHSTLNSLANAHECTIRIGVDAGDTFDYTREYNPLSILKVKKFGVHGGGTLRITGAINVTEGVSYNSTTNGTVLFADTSAMPSTRQGAMSSFNVNSGEVAFENAGIITSSQGFYVRDSSASYCTVAFGTNTVYSSSVRGYVADNNNSVGMMRIKPGAVLTNSLDIGTGSNAVGVVYQTGGFFDCLNAATRDGKWGGNSFAGDSYAYYGLDGGEVVIHGYTGLGTAVGNVGVIDIRGGKFRQCGQYLQIGLKGTGVVYQTGGTYQHTDSNPFTICDASYRSDYSDGCGVCTVSGSNAVMSINNAVLLAGRKDGVGILNVNDGARLSAVAGLVKASTQNEKSTDSAVPLTGNAAYVNFNGGKYVNKTTYNGNEMFGPKTATITGRGSPIIPDRVTIYEKGVTFETDNGYWGKISAPLKKPVGRQVVSIPLPGDLPAKYVGAPLVSIYSQTGVGATAAADFDPVSGTVTNITVTSGGWNYEDARVVIQRGGADTCAFDLPQDCFAAVQDGGMVKLGKNELKVYSECDFTGPVDIRNGTLSLQSGGSFASTVMRMNTNATFLVNNGSSAFTVTDFTGGGTISGSAMTIDGAWHLTRDGRIAASGKLTVSANAVIDVASGEELPKARTVIATSDDRIVLGGNVTCPDGFRLVLSSDSRKLTVSPLGGMVLLFR